ncbi:hypothetical protein GCM10028773_48240 [Spirosoma koreense]
MSADVELIVIDDASDDNTVDYLQYVTKKLSKVSYFSFSENKGVNAARNKGVSLATGEYILFLDSDDYLKPESISLVLSYLRNKPHTHYMFLVSDRESDPLLPDTSQEYTYFDWLRRNVYGDFTHVLKTDLLRKYPFFEEFRGFENLNWFRIFKENHTQLFIRDCLCIRDRTQSDSLTRVLNVQTNKKLFDRYQYSLKMADMYGEDYLLHAKYAFHNFLLKAIALGILLKHTKANNQLLLLLRKINPVAFLLLAPLNNVHLNWVVTVPLFLKNNVKVVYRRIHA